LKSSQEKDESPKSFYGDRAFFAIMEKNENERRFKKLINLKSIQFNEIKFKKNRRIKFF